MDIQDGLVRQFKVSAEIAALDSAKFEVIGGALKLSGTSPATKV
jgi:hypothetical protein